LIKAESFLNKSRQYIATCMSLSDTNEDVSFTGSGLYTLSFWNKDICYMFYLQESFIAWVYILVVWHSQECLLLADHIIAMSELLLFGYPV